MVTPLDLDQLRTFVAITETGSFTRAAEEVFRTQSAVSMQMRRLEERLGKTLFEKDGRNNRLTTDGEKLLLYARELLRLNRETLAAFDEESLEGHIRIGMPDDYADRFLPEIMTRFSRSNPRVEMSIICEPTVNLITQIQQGLLDVALVTDHAPAQMVRREPLLWVGSANHETHRRAVLPMAFGRPTCTWRQHGCTALDKIGRDYRVMFTSYSATAVAAAVLSGGAITIMPECSLRPGMRVLGEADEFPPLPDCVIGILRRPATQMDVVDAFARHITESLDNISATLIETSEDVDFNNGMRHMRRAKRMRPDHILPGW